MFITKEITIVSESCPECGIVFGIESEYLASKRKNGETVYCPNGHTFWYGKGEAERLKAELKRERENKDYWRNVAEVERHAKNGMKGQLRKTQNELGRTKERIANGACPCCHRQFVNLERHMSGKHPDYVKDGDK